MDTAASTPTALPRHRPRWLAWRQWPRETRDTLFLLGVIGWVIGPHLLHLPGWCAALTAVVLGWRAVLALQGGPLPSRWPVIAVLLVAVTLTAVTQRTLLGREAGVTLLVVLMALKTLELRARRDAIVVFFLGFFLVLTQCLYSQSLGMALAMLVSTWGLLTALVLGNLPVGRPSLWRAGGIAARSALLGLPLMAVLYLLFPRFGPLWGLPEDGIGRTGLSGTLRLGGVAELANDDSIAFRLRIAPGSPPLAPEQLYFRGPVLARFDGVDWQQSPLARLRPPGLQVDLQVQGRPVVYSLQIEPGRLSLLPLLEATPATTGDRPALPEWDAWQGHDLMWHTERPVDERLVLQARAYTQHRHGLGLPPGEREALLRLPEGFNPRTRAWAAQVQARLGAVDARTLAAALEAHIRQQPYVYTLAPTAYGRDAVDEFWFDGREGFCEHYATAFVVLMRAMGVPARVVTGYQGAEPPDPDGWRIVRQSHAHAWAEYWQADLGWQRADPTAAVAPERVRASRPLPPRPGLVDSALRSLNPDLAEQMRLAWAMLDSRWNQAVMGWSRSRQLDLLRDLGVPRPDATDLARGLVVLMALAATAAALWAWRDRTRQDPRQRRQARLTALLRRAGVAAAPHHPPRSLALQARTRLGPAATPLAEALELLDRERYGPHGHGGWAHERRLWDQALRLAGALERAPSATPPATPPTPGPGQPGGQPG